MYNTCWNLPITVNKISCRAASTVVMLVNSLVYVLIIAIPSVFAGWHAFPEQRTPPSPRQQAMSVTVGDTLYIWGGLDSINNPVSDMWTFNMTSLIWRQLPALGAKVSSHHGCLWYYNNEFIMFGGVAPSGIDTNLVSIYSFVDFSWATLPYDHSAPPSRMRMSCQSMTFDNQGVRNSRRWIKCSRLLERDLDPEVLFFRLVQGSYTWFYFLRKTSPLHRCRTNAGVSGRDMNDTWLVELTKDGDSFSANLTDVSNLISGSPIATYLAPSTLTPDGDLVILGGWLRVLQRPSDVVQVLSTHNSPDVATWQWKSFPLVRGDNHEDFAFDSGTCSLFIDRLFVFGGYYSNRVENSLLLLHLKDLSDPHFHISSHHFPSPVALTQHKAVTVGNRMFLIGGVRSQLSGTQTLVWYLDLSTFIWSSDEVVSSFAPDYYTGHSVVSFGRRIFSLLEVHLLQES
ncbi:hypothetical protein GEMRC1_002765 [Eukaryota sp. GEM-RC1]